LPDRDVSEEVDPLVEPLVVASVVELVLPVEDPEAVPLSEPVVVVSIVVELELPGTATVEVPTPLTPQLFTQTRTCGSNWPVNCSSVQLLPSVVSVVPLGETAAPSMQRSMHARTGAS
jgi:hypothetical protein